MKYLYRLGSKPEKIEYHYILLKTNSKNQMFENQMRTWAILNVERSYYYLHY